MADRLCSHLREAGRIVGRGYDQLVDSGRPFMIGDRFAAIDPVGGVAGVVGCRPPYRQARRPLPPTYPAEGGKRNSASMPADRARARTAGGACVPPLRRMRYVARGETSPLPDITILETAWYVREPLLLAAASDTRVDLSQGSARQPTHRYQ